MFSVTNTGTWTLPLWTAIVRPTKSGVIVLARAQVLMMVRSSLPSAATFLASLKSMNGPFFSERLMTLLLVLIAYQLHTQHLLACLLIMHLCVQERHWLVRNQLIQGNALECS